MRSADSAAKLSVTRAITGPGMRDAILIARASRMAPGNTEPGLNSAGHRNNPATHTAQSANA